MAKLTDLSVYELRKSLAANLIAVGPDAASTRAILRALELKQRPRSRRAKRKAVQHDTR